MKYIIIVFLIAQLFPEIDILKNNIERLEIRKTEFDISTIYRISCDGFEEQFSKDEIKTIIIEDELSIRLFSKFMKNNKCSSKRSFPDVRAKIYIYYSNNSIDTLCMDNFHMNINGVSYLINEDIKRFVQER